MEKVFPKIIMHMKTRFQRNDNFPLSLDEILDEIQVFSLPEKIKNNLDNMVLPKNPKLECIFEKNIRKYSFKPSFIIKNRRELINLIKTQQANGEGGVLLDDVQEAMTTEDFDRVYKKFGEEIVVLNGKGKKKILYFNDKNSPENIQVDEELVKYWRDVAVEGLDENKIEEYLEKQGIASMKDGLANTQTIPGGKRKASARGRQSKKHNDHMGNILNEYNPDLIKK